MASNNAPNGRRLWITSDEKVFAIRMNQKKKLDKYIESFKVRDIFDDGIGTLIDKGEMMLFLERLSGRSLI
jgi:hypothetical protein